MFLDSVMSASEEALQAGVKALEEELMRLKAQLRGKNDGAQSNKETLPASKAQENGGIRRKEKRAFDFAAHPRRHVALRLAYLGWQYQGFAVQENTDNTVEARLFEALLKTKLIQDRQSSSYHRCGRTDKGVSAFSQVQQQPHAHDPHCRRVLDYSSSGFTPAFGYSSWSRSALAALVVRADACLG